MKLLRRTRLFKRLPTVPLFWRPKSQQNFVESDIQNYYPLLNEDFNLLEKELMPLYRKLDNKALEMQNHFRFYQVLLIVGGALTSVLAVVLLVFIDNIPVAETLSILGVICAGALTAFARAGYRSNAQKLYFTNRLAAEILRSEYFLFLGQIGYYNDDQNRRRNLLLRLADVEKIAKGGKA